MNLALRELPECILIVLAQLPQVPNHGRHIQSREVFDPRHRLSIRSLARNSPEQKGHELCQCDACAPT